MTVGTFIGNCSNETHKDDCLKKTSKFRKSFIMLFKCQTKMAIFLSTINTHECIGILDNFQFSSTENWFGVDEVIFQDDSASYYIAKRIKTFHQKKVFKSMAELVNIPVLY